MKVRVFGHYVAPSMIILVGVEFLLLIATFYTGYMIRWHWLGGRWIRTNEAEATTFAFVFLITMIALGLYQRASAHNLRETFLRLMFASVIAFAALTVMIFVFPFIDIWRSTLAWVFPLTPIALMTSRFAFLHIASLEGLREKVLVVGTGRSAARIQKLETERGAGFEVVGFVEVPNTGGEEVDPARVFKGATSIADVAEEKNVEEVVVCVEDRRGKLPMEQLLACRSADVRVTEYSRFWERETAQVDLDAFYPSFLVFSDHFVGGRFQVGLKRVFDVSVSALLLVLSAPIMLVTALLIRLTSPGPIFYRQERSGRLGIAFDILKFRSMRVDAESDGKPRWAQEKDPRVTRIGEFIRKTRIDELPQIFNVLRGEMSFVGPRPERPFFNEQLAKEIPYYNERHRVKPGITGWAQLKFPYGASAADARGKLQFDLYYVKNYSVFLDALIILQTVRIILFRVGSR